MPETCIKYSGLLPQARIIELNEVIEKNIVLSNSNCSITACLLMIFIPHGMLVKISINQLLYEGTVEYNDNCKYGGLSISMFLYYIWEGVLMCGNIT